MNGPLQILFLYVRILFDAVEMEICNIPKGSRISFTVFKRVIGPKEKLGADSSAQGLLEKVHSHNNDESCYAHSLTTLFTMNNPRDAYQVLVI